MKCIQACREEKASIVDQIHSLRIIPKGETRTEFQDRQKRIKKLKENLKRINWVIMYLETNPNQSFIEAQIGKINNRIEKIEEGFDHWKAINFPATNTLMAEKNARRIYYKELGVGHLRTQLANLRFIK